MKLFQEANKLLFPIIILQYEFLQFGSEALSKHHQHPLLHVLDPVQRKSLLELSRVVTVSGAGNRCSLVLLLALLLFQYLQVIVSTVRRFRPNRCLRQLFIPWYRPSPGIIRRNKYLCGLGIHTHAALVLVNVELELSLCVWSQ